MKRIRIRVGRFEGSANDDQFQKSCVDTGMLVPLDFPPPVLFNVEPTIYDITYTDGKRLVYVYRKGVWWKYPHGKFYYTPTIHLGEKQYSALKSAIVVLGRKVFTRDTLEKLFWFEHERRQCKTDLQTRLRFYKFLKKKDQLFLLTKRYPNAKRFKDSL